MQGAERAWRFGAWTRDGTASTTLDLGRVVDPDEIALLAEARVLLTETLDASPYARLQGKYEDWRTVLSDAVTLSGSGHAPSVRRRLSDALDDLLSALRGFDDRTSHGLSRRYGEDSEERRVFKAALSFEFDNAFAYRFCCKLRNYSQHGDASISDLTMGSLKDANGNVQRYCRPVFDSQTLLANYESWGKVKPDLQAIGGKFSATAIIDELMLSCERVFARTTLIQAPHLTAAIAVIQRMAGLAAPNGEQPVLVSIDDEAARRGEIHNMSVEPIPVELAVIAETALQQCAELVGGRGGI